MSTLVSQNPDDSQLPRKRKLSNSSIRNGKSSRMGDSIKDDSSDLQRDWSALSYSERLHRADREYQSLLELSHQLTLLTDYSADQDNEPPSSSTPNYSNNHDTTSPQLERLREKIPAGVFSMLCMLRARIYELQEENTQLRRERDDAYRDPPPLKPSASPNNTVTNTTDDSSRQNLNWTSIVLSRKLQNALQENKELGEALSSGLVASLKEEIASLKQIAEERKKSLKESQTLIRQLDEENETAQDAVIRLSQLVKRYEKIHGPLKDDISER